MSTQLRTAPETPAPQARMCASWAQAPVAGAVSGPRFSLSAASAVFHTLQVRGSVEGEGAGVLGPPLAGGRPSLWLQLSAAAVGGLSSLLPVTPPRTAGFWAKGA